VSQEHRTICDSGGKLGTKNGKSQLRYGILQMMFCILQRKYSTTMNHLLLGAFYDNVNKNVGPTLMWVFILLMTIELIYVMVKYLGSSDEK